VLDLGCGSGRLFGHLLPAAPRRLVGVDGSEALLERARRRIATDPRLRDAMASGRMELRVGDVRAPAIGAARFSLVVLAGVLPHLPGPDDAQRALMAARRCLTRRGRVVVDLPGPGALPERDLPLAVDWRRRWRGRTVVRRSQLWRQPEADALRVMLSTLVEMREADGTITRLPAAYRLWYPEAAALERLVAGARLRVAALFGSHDLEPFGATSERLIVIAERG
jgi:SAM-dependent methyltransferase